MSYSIVLHAGAAESWIGDSQTQVKTEAFLHKLVSSAECQLKVGETALEVVTKVVSALEDYPQFNAGKGSALNIDGYHELEAAIIDGRSCRYRAAGGLQRTKNPIKLAHMMLDFEAPALVVGTAADELAETIGLEMVDNSYFTTDSRRLYWESKMNRQLEDHGTVGAVALDVHGSLAAANSTGGLTFKHRGRIGDTAIVGAGIYADDEVAVVCSGSGDAILQATVAGRAAAAARSGIGLHDAIESAILASAELYPQSSCGVIAVNRSGSITTQCNSRIFAVASAESSSGSLQTGITGLIIPILSLFTIFEDEKVRAGMAKYPTFPNQIVVQPRQKQPVLSFAADDFVDFFLRLRKLIQGVLSPTGSDDAAFVTSGESPSSFVFPVLRTRASQDASSNLDQIHTTTHRDLHDGHRATFKYFNNRLVKIEIQRPEKTSLFSSSLPQYTKTVAQIWNVLQTIDVDSTQLQLEIHPDHKSCATISLIESRPSSFPRPATFCNSLPECLTTELGPRVMDIDGLVHQAGAIRNHLTGWPIVTYPSGREDEAKSLSQ